MIATLFVVVASRAGVVSWRAGELLVSVPGYAGFLLVMAVLGVAVARTFRLDVPPVGK